MKTYSPFIVASRKAFVIVLLIMAVIASFLQPSQAQVSPKQLSPEAQDAMARGMAAAKQQQWDLAIKYFGEARKAAPTSPEALFNLALALDKAGGLEVIAIPWYRAFLASAPKAANAEQVKNRIIELEVRVEANIHKLIRMAKDSSPVMEEYLLNSEKALSSERARLQIQIASMLGPKEKDETIAQLRQRYRHEKTAKPYRVLAEAQARVKDIKGARETWGRIGEEEISRRDVVQIIVAQQLKGNDIAGAKETAKVVSGNSLYESFVLSDIASVQAKAGDIKGAKETATKILESDYRAKSLIEIVNTQLDGGDLTGAEKTLIQAKEAASQIKDDSTWKTDIFAALAEAQIKAGDIIGAKEAIGRIKSDSLRIPMLYAQAANAQVKAGDIAGAKETVAQISDESSKSDALYTIAEAQLKAGDIVGARETAAWMIENWRKSSIYSSIAQEQAKAGDIAGAKETTSRIKSDPDPWKSHALDAIVGAQLKKADIPGAKETVQGIKDAYTRSNRWFEIVKAQVDAGDIPGGKEILNNIANDHYRILAYLHIARAEAKSGNIAAARDSIALAMKTIERIKEKASYQSIIGSAQSEIGDISEAKQTIAAIEDKYYKSTGYAAIATAQAKIGNRLDANQLITQAKETATGIEDKYHKTHALVAIAGAYVKMPDAAKARKELAQAMETAADIDPESLKAYSYERIAKVQMEAGNPEGARKASALEEQAKTREKTKAKTEMSTMTLKPADEIKSWAELVSSKLSKPSLLDYQEVIKKAKGKEPHEVVQVLAEVARDMAEALERIRANEADFQKRRKMS